MLGFGGTGVQSSLIHLSNLFPLWKSSATAIITGSFQLSYFIFYIFDYLWRVNHWNYKDIFLLYLILCSINFIISITIWPDLPIPFEKPEFYDDTKLGLVRAPSVFIHHSRAGINRIKSELWTIPDDENEEEYEYNVPNDTYEQNNNLITEISQSQSINKEIIIPAHDIKLQSFRKQFFSSEFLELAAFFIVSAFWVNFFIGTMDIQLGDSQLFTSEERSWYGKQCTTFMALGALTIPLVGLTMGK